MLIWFLAANTALAALFAVVKLFRQESAGMTAYFIFLPGLGFFIYYLPSLLHAFLKSIGVDQEAILIRAFEVELQPEHPDVREALNVVPVEDAMAVSENTEKRALLLKQLKKDLTENYRVLLAAERDEDSESAHYAAVAKTEIYRLHQTRWLECRRDYAENPDDPEMYHTACQLLTEMLSSGILSAREQSAYQKRLCDLVQNQIDEWESEVLPCEYEEYLGALVDLGRSEDAERLWREHADQMQSETAYQSMLHMFVILSLGMCAVFCMYFTIVVFYYFADYRAPFTISSIFLVITAIGAALASQMDAFYPLPIPLLAGGLCGWIVAFLLLRRRMENLDSFLMC